MMIDNHLEFLKSTKGTESSLGDTLEKCWRLSSVSGRTQLSKFYPFVYTAPSSRVIHRKTRLHRNPMVLALELADELKRDGISKAELSRRHGMSRARVTQWLSLLDRPRLEIERVLAIGDYWERRLVTERGLRDNESVASKPAFVLYV